MGEVLPLPSRGEAFEDLRGEGRTLRVSWHSQENTLVLSIWQLGQCRATFRLPSEQVPDLVRALVVAGLTDAASQRGPAAPAVPLHRLVNPPASGQSEAAAQDAPAESGQRRADPDTAHRMAAPAAVFLAPPPQA